jgi:hypothetical protein
LLLMIFPIIFFVVILDLKHNPSTDYSVVQNGAKTWGISRDFQKILRKSDGPFEATTSSRTK